MNEQQPVTAPPAYGPRPEREPQPPALDRFFGWLRSLGVQRDTDDKWLAGICAGVANRLGVDPLVVRAALVVLVLMGGIGVTIYLLAWLLLPDRDGSLLIEAALRRGDVVGILLLALVAVTVFGGRGLLFGDLFGGNGVWWVFWIGVPVAVVVWLFRRRDSHGQPVPVQQTVEETATRAQAWGTQVGQRVTELTQTKDETMPTSTQTTSAYAAPVTQAGTAPTAPPAYGPRPGSNQPPAYGPPPAPPTPKAPRPPKPPKPLRRKGLGFAGFLLAMGLSVVAFGAATMLHDSRNWTGDRTLIAMAAALGTLGLIVLVGGLAGRRAGFTGFVAVVTAFITWGVAVVPGLNVAGGVGDRTWTPSASADYDMGFGSATLDLGDIDNGRVDTELGIGELRIQIPEDKTVRVVGQTEIGSIDVRTEAFDQFGGDRTAPDLSTRFDDGPTGEGERIDQTFGEGEPDITVDADLGIGQITILTP